MHGLASVAALWALLSDRSRLVPVIELLAVHGVCSSQMLLQEASVS
jgi:hypothetical protein